MNKQILAAIESRRADLATEIAALKAQDAELAVAERALKRLLAGDSAGPRAAREPARTDPSPQKSQRRGRAPKFGDKSQRELVVDALSHAKGGWLDMTGIVESIRAATGIEFPSKALAPLISVLKREGVVVRQGRLVALQRRAKNSRPNAVA